MKRPGTTACAALAAVLVMILSGIFATWSYAMQVPGRAVLRTGDGQGAATVFGTPRMSTLHEGLSARADATPEPPRSDIPLPDDADVVFSTAEFIIYHTAESVDAVVEFYKQSMDDNGWESYTVTLQIQDVGCQSYIKDDEAAYIMITPGDSSTGVMIRVTGVADTWGGFAFDETPEADETAVPTETPQSGRSEETRLLYGMPLLPDASVDISSPDTIGYHSYVGVTEAGEFYEREMPQRSWKPAPDNEVREDVTTLVYGKGKRTALVTIMPGDGATIYVVITLGRVG